MTGSKFVSNLQQWKIRPINKYAVFSGEMRTISASDDVLVAYGLGSCVAICLYDPVAQVGGMLHALLPTAANENHRSKGSPTKFVDLGMPLLIESLLKLGATHNQLMAYLCGGAWMLIAPGFDDSLNIGERNVQAAEAALQAAGLRIRARATGGHIGRTVRLYIATGQVTVKTLEQGERALNAKRKT